MSQSEPHDVPRPDPAEVPESKLNEAYAAWAATWPWAAIQDFFLPIFNNGPLYCLEALHNHLHVAYERDAEEEALHSILKHHKDIDALDSCRSAGEHRGADVTLISSSIGALASTSTVPFLSSVLEAVNALSGELPYRHWAIEIEERSLACDLRRIPGSTNTEIRHASSASALVTDAGGIPLTDIQEKFIGRTYLTNVQIKSIIGFEGTSATQAS
jgi:hypothetical protein